MLVDEPRETLLEPRALFDGEKGEQRLGRVPRILHDGPSQCLTVGLR